MNGVSVTEKIQVKHGGRILLGNNHLYRLSCPSQLVGGQNGDQNELMDYEQAMKEISINELTNGELSVGGGRAVLTTFSSLARSCVQ